MSKSNLVYCPKCELKGKKEVLGALNKGRFIVLRFHKGETIIKSESFDVYCGKCGCRVYYRRTKLTSNYETTNSPNYGTTRLYR
jgi:hypothetical protein